MRRVIGLASVFLIGVSGVISGAQATVKKPKIQMKFIDANVKDVIIGVLGVACQKNVIFSPDVKGKVTVEFPRPVSCEEAESALEDALGLKIEDRGPYLKVETIQSYLAKEPIKYWVIQLKYVGAKRVAEKLKKIVKGSKGGQVDITYDQSTNSIIVKGKRADYENVRRLVSQIDKPQKQVIVKAKILTIDESGSVEKGNSFLFSFINKGGQIGGGYFFDGAQTGNGVVFPSGTTTVDGITNLNNTLALGILNKAQTLRLSLFLKALELEGKAQVISSPAIMTLDNEKGRIEQGIEIPYKEATVSSGGATTYQIKFKKASLILEVLPHITPDGMVKMEISVHKDSPNYDAAAYTGGEPAINTRQAKSTVRIKSGDTVVIGGIYEVSKSKDRTGVPVLSRIPLLGWLFKSEVQKESRKKLIILLTPEVVRYDKNGNVINGGASWEE
jgi:type IV pilus assembly protein PilQ